MRDGPQVLGKKPKVFATGSLLHLSHMVFVEYRS